jgi:hypothetical protein
VKGVGDALGASDGVHVGVTEGDRASAETVGLGVRGTVGVLLTVADGLREGGEEGDAEAVGEVVSVGVADGTATVGAVSVAVALGVGDGGSVAVSLGAGVGGSIMALMEATKSATVMRPSSFPSAAMHDRRAENKPSTRASRSALSKRPSQFASPGCNEICPDAGRAATNGESKTTATSAATTSFSTNARTTAMRGQHAYTDSLASATQKTPSRSAAALGPIFCPQRYPSARNKELLAYRPQNLNSVTRSPPWKPCNTGAAKTKQPGPSGLRQSWQDKFSPRTSCERKCPHTPLPGPSALSQSLSTWQLELSLHSPNSFETLCTTARAVPVVKANDWLNPADTGSSPQGKALSNESSTGKPRKPNTGASTAAPGPLSSPTEPAVSGPLHTPGCTPRGPH